MNTKQVITAAVISLIGSAAFAQTELELQHFGGSQPAASATTTRAAVRNEVLRARAAGELVSPTEADVAGLFTKPNKSSASALTRSEVRAEVLKARGDGSLTRALDLDAINDRNLASVRTRDEVRNEAIAATRAPRVQAGH
ncbi:MAG: DUF4148 domain-containing protein [Rhizobacter sp.]|nr:DUF4148 domain-containing protein [Rhizobacter sp.]